MNKEHQTAAGKILASLRELQRQANAIAEQDGHFSIAARKISSCGDIVENAIRTSAEPLSAEKNSK